MPRQVLLIHANTLRPPVNPLGLETVGEYLICNGIPVAILDLAWEQDWEERLRQMVAAEEPLAVGITFRNIDDCSSATRLSFLPSLVTVVQTVKRHTSAPVVLGGVGFSIMPRPILAASGADYGIAGDGEQAFLEFVKRLQSKKDVFDLPNMVVRRGNEVFSARRMELELKSAPVPSRTLFDNRRYQSEGAQVGIETKRGCAQPCVFCADPLAKGERQRLRPPAAVIQEMSNLVRQGIGWFHLCDSEFNLPIVHAKQVCRAILDAKLDEQINWFTYASPLPFDQELAELMVASGCKGVNFGVDALCDRQLARLERLHRIVDIENLVNILGKTGLNFMFDLMFGGPGETEQTLYASYINALRLDLPLVGVSEGVRIYPDTSLSRELYSDQLAIEARLLEPTYFFSPALGHDPIGAIREVLRDDPRFLLLSAPGDARSYNYAGDNWLTEAIKNGARGAYWNIIRTMRGNG